jgi:heme-degrading monooxygenase HmoA
VFVVVWTFDVVPGREHAFCEAYGPRGRWFELFGRWPGFVEIELIELHPGRYLTLDRWVDEAAYRRFMDEAASDYQELDGDLAGLCSEEVLVGRGVALDPRTT